MCMSFIPLLTTAFSCIMYGVVCTLVIMTILYFFLRLWNKCIVQGAVFYITGCVLFMMLSIQCSLMIGAIETNNLADGVKVEVNRLIERESEIITEKKLQDILDYLISVNPIIGVYVDVCDFSDNDPATFAATMAETLHGMLHTYIWHRVLWSIVLVTIACMIVALFAKGNAKQSIVRHYSQDERYHRRRGYTRPRRRY